MANELLLSCMCEHERHEPAILDIDTVNVASTASLSGAAALKETAALPRLPRARDLFQFGYIDCCYRSNRAGSSDSPGLQSCRDHVPAGLRRFSRDVVVTE